MGVGRVGALRPAHSPVNHLDVVRLLEPTEGDACIVGHSIRRESAVTKAALGIVPQDIALYPDLTARENLSFGQDVWYAGQDA